MTLPECGHTLTRSLCWVRLISLPSHPWYTWLTTSTRLQATVDARRSSLTATPLPAFPERPSRISATSPSSWAEISCLGSREDLAIKKHFVLFYFKCTVHPQAAPPSVLIPWNLFLLDLYFSPLESGTGREVGREAGKMRVFYKYENGGSPAPLFCLFTFSSLNSVTSTQTPELVPSLLAPRSSRLP